MCAKGVEGVLKKKKEIEDEWKKQRVLIAVVGQTGSGKSTIIHRLLGYQPGDQNGPVVGESVTECTKEAKEYLKEGTGLVYIDLPGIGSTTTTYAFSTRNDQDMYCTRFRLQTIDYFLLVSQNKFNNQEKLLADYITQILKKKFLFVQTKMDLLRKEYGNQIIEDNEGFDVVKTMIRTDIQKQLRLNTAERIFLVSNDVIKVRVDGQQRRTYDTSPDYEYDLLLKQIQDDMLGEEGLNNGIREELESLREASQTHLKRFLDMILVLLRDFCDIDSIMGGQMNEQKVCLSQPEKEIKYSDIFWKPTIENLDQAEEECTLSCLYLSKLKAEARSISGVR